MRIAPATAGHLPAILDAQRACYPAHLLEDAGVFASMLPHGLSFVLLHADAGDGGGVDQVGGYLVAHEWHTVALPPTLKTPLLLRTDGDGDAPCVFIHDVCVRPEWRGRGVARALLRRLQEQAEVGGRDAGGSSDADAAGVYTLVAVNGAAPAWERMGFVDAPRPCRDDVQNARADALASYEPGARFMLWRCAANHAGTAPMRAPTARA